MGLRKRDTQRGRVYIAERAAFESDKHGSGDNQLSIGKSYETLRGKRNRVKEIVSSKWWRDKSCATSVQVRHFDKQLGGGEAYPSLILMGIRENREWVLIHELSHVLMVTARFSYFMKMRIPAVPSEGRSHGRAFCRIFLAMVRRFIGIDAYNALRLSFKHNNVKFSRSAAD